MYYSSNENFVYTYGNSSSFLLLAVAAICVSRKAELPIIVAFTVAAISFVVDDIVFASTFYFLSFELGINDYIGLGVAVLSIPAVWLYLNKPKISISTATVLPVLSILILVYSRNIDFKALYFDIDYNSMFYIGDAISIFLMSMYFLRKTQDIGKIIATYFVIVATGNMLDDLFFDPNKVHFHELYFAVGGLLYCGYLWRKQSRAIT